MLKLLDKFRDSLGEGFDVILYTLLLTYVISYFLGHNPDIAFIGFLIVPLFIIFSPYIKRVQKRGILEIIVKVPVYLILGLTTFAIAFSNFILDSYRYSTPLYILCILGLVWFAYRTLKKYSHPVDFKPYNERRFPASLWIFIFVFSASTLFLLELLFGVFFFELDTWDSLISLILIIISSITSLFSISWVFFTLLAGKK